MEKEYILSLANECLNCKNPTCVKGCPINNNIPKFISLLKYNKIDEAYDVIKEKSTLPSICSLVCPINSQCVGNCIKNKLNKPVLINKIEHYISLNGKNDILKVDKNEYKVAIIGSGPAGLACAERLSLKGYNVDIYDKYSVAGGILTYGIPDFVLNKDIVNDKIKYLKELGVNFYLNKELNTDFTINDLKEKYDAIFVAIGASIERKMNLENEDLKGVLGANYVLKKIYEDNFNDVILNKNSNVIVVGGGNTAIDVSRVIKRKYDCNVNIVYRRSLKEMPARYDEYLKAVDDGIVFNFLTNPISFIGKEKIKQVECIKMELVNVSDGRAKPVEIKGSNFIIDTDLIVLAISCDVDSSLINVFNKTKYNSILTDENMKTSLDKVFAGGDCVRGPSLVVNAMKDGIKAANSIDEYIKNS